MPVERTGIGNTHTDETDGNVTTKETPNSAVSTNSSSASTTVLNALSSNSIGKGTSMDIGKKIIINNVQQPLETKATELEKTENSAGGGGISKDAPTLKMDSALTVATNTNAKVVSMAVTNSAAPVGKQITLQTVPVSTSASLKRPNNSTQGPTVTKVIITKTPGSSQPQVVPLQLSQLQGQTLSLTSFPQGLNVVPQTPAQGSLTPTKTITISSQGIVTSGRKQIMTNLGGIPTKLVNKIPISAAAKTPPKITMIPVSLGKSPQRAPLAPGSSVVVTRTISSAVSNSSSGTTVVASTGQMKPATITMSPTKVILKPANQVNKSLPINISAAPVSLAQLGLTSTTPAGVQQISVPGSKFHYVRLVTPTAQNTSSSVLKTSSGQVMQVKPIAPASSTLTSNPVQARIATPTGTVKSVISQGAGQQRILLPAPNQVNIRPALSAPTQSTVQIPTTATASSNFSNLPPGTTLISSQGNIPGVQGFALVPAQYVNQLRQQGTAPKPIPQQPQQPQQPPPQPQPVQVSKPSSPPQGLRTDFIPIASIDPIISANTLARNVTNGTTIEATGARPRKPCNCTKSQCLKLYCDCFANGEFCHNCNCTNCANNLEHEEGRSRAIKACLDRNPMAFHPKIGKGRVGDGDRRHNKGCNCKKSGCLKNYCECYEAKIMCSSACKCVGCKNFEESPERKTLMHLADAAEVRVQQQTAAKSKLSSQISYLPLRPTTTISGERLPYTFVTTDVAEATCACLLAQLEEADRLKMPEVVQERMVIEEFGRCLMQIIDSANKTRDTPILSEVFSKGKTKPTTRIVKKSGGGDG